MASIEYIAGFVDGEGSIQISRGTTHYSGKRMYYLRLSVHQVDRRPLDVLNERWPGSLRLIRKPSAKQRDIWEWVVSGSTAAKVIGEIRPYLIGKAEQADLALEFYSRINSNGRAAISDDELSAREELYQRMGILKGTTALRESRRNGATIP